MSIFLLKTKLNFMKSLATVCCFISVWWIFKADKGVEEAINPILGDFLVIIYTILYSLNTVLMKLLIP